MTNLKTPEEIQVLREGGKILAEITESILSEVKEGVTSKELDEKAHNLFKERGGKPSFFRYKPEGALRPFPSALCVSVNNEVVHGIANEDKKIFKEGDIVGIDIGLEYKGLFTDMARSKIIGETDSTSKELVNVTNRALQNMINQVRPGTPVWKLGQEVEKVASSYGFGVIEVLGGHGVGRAVHEDPFIPNYAEKDFNTFLKKGMVIAVEPMLNEGAKDVFLTQDNWTFKTSDGKRSAHFEDTLVITEGEPEVITR